VENQATWCSYLCFSLWTCDIRGLDTLEFGTYRLPPARSALLRRLDYGFSMAPLRLDCPCDPGCFSIHLAWSRTASSNIAHRSSHRESRLWKSSFAGAGACFAACNPRRNAISPAPKLATAATVSHQCPCGCDTCPPGSCGTGALMSQ